MAQMADAKTMELPPQAGGEQWLMGHLPAFQADPLELSLRWALTGPVLRIRFGPVKQYVLSDPDCVAQVLQNQRNYIKPPRFLNIVREAGGPASTNLFTSEGEPWLALRRTMQPAFHRQHIAQFADAITGETSKMLARWQENIARGEPVRLESEMMRLTMAIISRIMLSLDIGPEADALEDAFRTLARVVMDRLMSIVSPPSWLPTPDNRKFEAALATLERVLDRILQERKASGVEQGDLLDMLISARDPETGEALTRDQLISEMQGIVFAGHETTAAALTWTFYLLSEHPAVQAQLDAELATVLGGRLPALADLDKLTYTRQIFQEAMRLYPPAWTTSRQAVDEDEIGGYHVPAGMQMFINIYGLQRHPAYWAKPNEFDPAHFAPEAVAARPKFAYLPFGTGARKCIGESLAMLEGQLILATVAQAVRMTPRPEHRVEPKAIFVLHTANDVLMDVTAR